MIMDIWELKRVLWSLQDSQKITSRDLETLRIKKAELNNLWHDILRKNEAYRHAIEYIEKLIKVLENV